MSAERHQRIKQIFLDALEYAGEEREAFLDASCGDDGSMREEVESLLAHHRPEAAFEPLVVSAGADRPSKEKPLRFAAGDVFAERYRVVDRLGRGGMGEVYRADDLTLGTPVALKLLHTADSALRTQLLQEVKLARQITHPAVCRVYDLGEAEGELYFTMEYLEGEDLSSLLKRAGRLPSSRVAEMGSVLCEGLAAAHARGVLHLDLKPANVLIDESGQVRITDFGIATTLEEARLVSATYGTPGYMAPEQLGTPHTLSERTDLYSLALVLYELVAGQPAFDDPSMTRVLEMQREARPTPPSRLVPDVDPELERILLQALEKDPARRPESASAMGSRLSALTQGAGQGAAVEGRAAAGPADASAVSAGGTAGGSAEVAAGSREAEAGAPEQQRGVLVGVGVAFLFIVVFLGLWRGSSVDDPTLLVPVPVPAPQAQPEPVARPTLAILPFENLSSDTENAFLADGITEDLYSLLAETNSLRVLARTSVRNYARSQQSLPQLAREIGLTNLLEGSVRRQGARVRVSVQLIDAVDETQVWASDFERELDSENLFELQSEVARAIASALQMKFTPEDQARLARRPTADPAAYDRYLLGRRHFERVTEADLLASIQHFREAVELDPNFADAWSYLALSYTLAARGGVVAPAAAYPQASESARRALAIDDRLDEAHLAMARVLLSHDWRWDAALLSLGRVLVLNPDSARAHLDHAYLLSSAGRFDESIAAVDRAIALDPGSPFAWAQRGRRLLDARDYEAAAEAASRALELEPGHAGALSVLGFSQLMREEYSAAIEAFEGSLADFGESPIVIANLGYALGRAGRAGDARAALTRLEALASQRFVSPVYRAFVHLGMGEREASLRWLEGAVEQRDPASIWLAVDPHYDILRDEPRFAALVEKVGAPVLR
ncbi:MAG: protein kinase [Deltaproteobacteria bacterium]|nr:protein kinase [Deltaproteobacteria bacterium]